MATLSGGIGNGSKWLLDKIVGVIAATGINPNLLTFLGLVVNFGAAAFFAVGRFFAGALIIFFAGFLDILDGQVARRQNRVTAFGAFYDSTLDRYADMALYMGLLVYYSVTGRTPYVVLAAVATAGSVMVSYARARAESLIPLCKVGFMERPERIVLLIIGGLFNRMGPVLWVIAVVSTLTVIHRIYFNWQETRAGRVLPGIRLSLYLPLLLFFMASSTGAAIISRTCSRNSGTFSFFSPLVSMVSCRRTVTFAGHSIQWPVR